MIITYICRLNFIQYKLLLSRCIRTNILLIDTRYTIHGSEIIFLEKYSLRLRYYFEVFVDTNIPRFYVLHYIQRVIKNFKFSFGHYIFTFDYSGFVWKILFSRKNSASVEYTLYTGIGGSRHFHQTEPLLSIIVYSYNQIKRERAIGN